jgi:hypothetical protein
MPMRRFITSFFALAFICSMFLTIRPVSATHQPPPPPEHVQVTLCHATSSESNPFTSNTVDDDSVVKTSGHDGHSGDIIPSFTYKVCVDVPASYSEWGSPQDNKCYGGESDTCRNVKISGDWHHQHRTLIEAAHKDCSDVTYAGKNLTTMYEGFTGAEVLANGCEIPEPLPVPGCMDEDALNYNPLATVEDQSCTYPPVPVPGCMDEEALNYNPQATVEDQSCTYPPEIIYGCMDEKALNYNPEATADDQSCTYPPVIPPEFCGAHDTGADLYQLYMYNSSPDHYGYFVDNGIKMGVCQIVTYDGGFPNATAVRTGCECGLPETFSWITTGFDVYSVWVNCRGEYFYRDSEGHTVVPFGTFVFGQYCTTAECPLR